VAAIATQIIIDGPRNTVAKTTGDFTMNALPGNTTILDPATLTDMMPGMSGTHLATLLRIDEIEYSISDNVTAQLYWNATTPVLICELYGRGKLEAKSFGGYQNNAGAGVNGQISLTLLVTDATATATTGSILLVLRTVKMRPISVGGA
jgi:hypothetical protein